jgi:hypothetical protein
MAEDEEPFDASFLKDLADIIKNKTLFFIPFFGALLAFLFTKADYIKSSNAVIWVLLAVLLGASLRYIQLVSQLLWAIESLRFVFNIRKLGTGAWPEWEKDKAASVDLLKLVPELMKAEGWWFRKVMVLMYFALGLVLYDIFFGQMVRDLITMLFARFHK